MRRDLGDFQTPPALVAAVLDVLGPVGKRWARVLEPTCGRGHFLAGLLAEDPPPREIRGIEIQDEHCRAAAIAAVGDGKTRVEVVQANVFGLDLGRDLRWREQGPLLVVGNPPWITNAELGVLGSTNAPRKRNLKGLRGLEAMTGASNFDIAEAIWLKLLDQLRGEDVTIALLCKTSVARNVLQFAARTEIAVVGASVHKVDALAWFRAAVDACLFQVTLGQGDRIDRIPVFSSLSGRKPESEWGFARGRLVADISNYETLAFADGVCPLEWRQGLKHDAADVMELTRETDSGWYFNKLGEPVDVEPEYLYPLLKGSDLGRPDCASPPRAVIVTQRRIGDETRNLEHDAPRLWKYLDSHSAAFAKRKSSIYRGQPEFAMFGIGPYSFAPYKVGVSGLHKTPRFRALGPVRGRAVMLDDTCYFVPCSTPEEAALATALLNDPASLGLIRSLTFRDSKRPVTKAVLRRVDLSALRQRIDPQALQGRVDQVLRELTPDVTVQGASVVCAATSPLAIDLPDPVSPFLGPLRLNPD